jgi:hypothetical protein
MARPAKKVKKVPSKRPRKKACKGDPHDLICIDINGWMKEMKKWADSVTKEVNELNQATGDPDKVPPPPEPPFN